MPAKMLARLKPYNPKRGFKIRRFSVHGIRFDVGGKWYVVDPHVAEYLKTVKNDNNDPDSPFAFDVCTEEAAKTLMQDEREVQLRAGIVEMPRPVLLDMTADGIKAQADAASQRSTAQLAVVDPDKGVEPDKDAGKVKDDDELGDDDEHEETGALTTDALPKPSNKRKGGKKKG
jgi:hypothetical protein